MVTISQGNTYKLIYNITGPGGSPKDLSGSLQLKYALAIRKDDTPLIEYTLDDPELEITDPAGGVITITLTSTALNPLPERQYYHELWQVNTLGDPTTLMGESLFLSSKLIKE